MIIKRILYEISSDEVYLWFGTIYQSPLFDQCIIRHLVQCKHKINLGILFYMHEYLTSWEPQ